MIFVGGILCLTIKERLKRTNHEKNKSISDSILPIAQNGSEDFINYVKV